MAGSKRELLDFVRRLGDNYDVFVRCGDTIFKAHKFVLASQSQYFDTVFQQPQYQDTTQIPTIDVDPRDIKPDNLKLVMQYIYIGHIENIDLNSWELMFAANYLMMDRLKTQCEFNLKDNITVDNCVDFIMGASTCRAPYLRRFAGRFIREHKNEVDPEDMQRLQQRFPELYAELFTQQH